MKYNSISQSKLKEYFDKLKSSGKVFTVTEKDDELIQWAE
jgi:FMN-dependent NADH-azoreductase